MKQRGRVLVQIASGVTVLLIIAAGPFGIFRTSGTSISKRGLELSETSAGAVAHYKFFFTGASTALVGSIRLQLCSNDPFPETPCTAPNGLDMGKASLQNQSGMTGFTISPLSTPNEIILTRPPLAGTTVPVIFEFSNITNPSTVGPLYARITTYASQDATGNAIDYGGLAVYIGPSAISVKTFVPPYLLFCIGSSINGRDCTTATGNYIDFGTFSTAQTGTGRTQIVVASNAAYGFLVAVQGTTMTSGINVIQQLTSPDVSRQGVSQFGMNLRANSTPKYGEEPTGYGLSAIIAKNYSQPNYFTFNSGDIIVQATQPDAMKYAVSYIVNVSKSQIPGVYVSTLQYIALASF